MCVCVVGGGGEGGEAVEGRRATERFNISGNGGGLIWGTWHVIGGLDNHLETMLYYLNFICLRVAIYICPVT